MLGFGVIGVVLCVGLFDRFVDGCMWLCCVVEFDGLMILNVNVLFLGGLLNWIRVLLLMVIEL